MQTGMQWHMAGRSAYPLFEINLMNLILHYQPNLRSIRAD